MWYLGKDKIVSGRAAVASGCGREEGVVDRDEGWVVGTFCVYCGCGYAHLPIY